MNKKQSNHEIQTNLVYYFSGTGNSYHIAKTIAEKINANLEPIISLELVNIIEADVLCFVFPSYDFKPPKKVTEIIKNLKKIRANYLVAITTYGVALNKALTHFKKTLNRKGVSLDCGYGIKMPHNAVGSIGFSDSENAKRIQKANEKTKHIINVIQSRFIVKVEKTSKLENISMIKQLPYIIKIIGILIFKGTKSLQFTVTDACIQCTLCENICPTHNIELIGMKPVFKDDCTSCFACLQWCPKTAIQIGKYSFNDLGMRQYTHPNVKVEDLINDNLGKSLKAKDNFLK